MAKLENEFILIAGSISKKTEKASIDLAHDFTRALTKSVLAAQGGHRCDRILRVCVCRLTGYA